LLQASHIYLLLLSNTAQNVLTSYRRRIVQYLSNERAPSAKVLHMGIPILFRGIGRLGAETLDRTASLPCPVLFTSARPWNVHVGTATTDCDGHHIFPGFRAGTLG